MEVLHVIAILSFSFVFVSGAAGVADDAIGCFEDGECTGGTAIDFTQADTAEECAVACGEYNGCNFFTHYTTNGACLYYDTCPNLDIGCSPECVSGRDCSCIREGKCDGVTVSTAYTDDEFACMDECRAVGACNWMTFTRDLKLCVLLENCAGIDEDFTSAVSAPKYCSGSTGEDPLRVMVALGHSGADNYMDGVEIVDLGKGNSSCIKPPQYPREMYEAAGAFVGGKARICGGFGGGSNGHRECYEYALGDESWTLSFYSLTEWRHQHESFVLANGSWLIVGGGESGARDTTEIYTGLVMEMGPGLPENFYYPVGTVVNSTHIWLAGSGSEDSSFLVDVDAWEFTRMPDMAERRERFSCGMAENGVGEMELVVAGGRYLDPQSTVEIFNFGSWSWRQGPRLPHNIGSGEQVQLPKTFLIVGGIYDDGTLHYLDTIYEFDNVNSAWILRNETLETGREYHVAIPLPNDWDVC